MEICALSDVRLNTMSEWQRAIDAEGFGLRLSSTSPLAEVRGFLKSYLNNEQTAFECHHVPAREMIDTYHNIDFGHEWKYALVFVWGGNFVEMRAAWMAAAAYARATSGIVFDPQAGQLFSASEAVDVVTNIKV